MTRKNISSGTEWENLAGYSRAVVVGNRIWVAGTTATDAEGNIVGIGDPVAQTTQVINNIAAALHKAGAELRHVVRTRIYITDVRHWEAVAWTHGSFFGDIRPAATLVVVNTLILPEMLVEIEAEAVVE